MKSNKYIEGIITKKIENKIINICFKINFFDSYLYISPNLNISSNKIFVIYKINNNNRILNKISNNDK